MDIKCLTTSLAQLPTNLIYDKLFPCLSSTDLALIAETHPRFHALVSKTLKNINENDSISLSKRSRLSLVIDHIDVYPHIDLNDASSVVIYSSSNHSIQLWHLPLANITSFLNLPSTQPPPLSVRFSRSANIIIATCFNAVKLYSVVRSLSPSQQIPLTPLASVIFTLRMQNMDTEHTIPSGSYSTSAQSTHIATALSPDNYLAVAHLSRIPFHGATAVQVQAALLNAHTSFSCIDITPISPARSDEPTTNSISLTHPNKGPFPRNSCSHVESIAASCNIIPSDLFSTVIVPASSKTLLRIVDINADPFRLLFPPGAVGDNGLLIDPMAPLDPGSIDIPKYLDDDGRALKVCFSYCGKFLFVISGSFNHSSHDNYKAYIKICKLEMKTNNIVFERYMSIQLTRPQEILDFLLSGNCRLVILVIGYEYERTCIVTGWQTIDTIAGGSFLINRTVDLVDESDKLFSVSEDGQLPCFPKHTALADQIYSLQVFSTATGDMVAQVDNRIAFKAKEFYEEDGHYSIGCNGCKHPFLRNGLGLVSITSTGSSYAFATLS